MAVMEASGRQIIAFIFASIACSSCRGSELNTVRGGATGERYNTIRRIYGKHNADVRANVHELEISSEYARTGVRADPNFKVPYQNHPMEKRKRQRRTLKEENPSLSEDEISTVLRKLDEGDEEDSNFKKMRIVFETSALESLIDQAGNDADEVARKVAFINDEILPRTGDFWSEALKVVPVKGNLVMQQGELSNKKYCGDSEFTQVPESHLSEGVENADLILYVSGTPSTRFCGPTTLAVAVACNFDQYDRPTAGAINFCLDQVEVDNNGYAPPAIVDDNVDVAIHEAAHVLGMSSNSYRFFWDSETGEPRTNRQKGFQIETVECVDGVERAMYMPDTNTLDFFTAENGQRYASIVTPKVRTVARNQFNCDSVEGGQLENQPTGSSSCTGDHWDERLYYPESLSGVISPASNFLSPLTLALMEDSGWYSANYAKSKVSPWGHRAGCDFVKKDCLVLDVNDDTIVPEYGRGYFCTKSNQRGCSASHTYKMGCTIMDYDIFYSSSAPPEQYQYFPDEPTVGGPRQADYCPVFGSVYKQHAHDLDCRDPNNENALDIYAESYGEKSMCFESSSGVGKCHDHRCMLTNFTLEVNVNGKWETCERDFQEIEVKVGKIFSGSITCPRLSSACPDMFCPANCAGRGECVDDEERGRPACKCFDTTDTSEACSISGELDGKYLTDSSGLIDRIEDDFFEPLIAVFVDNPDEWSRETWIWASALFVVFLLLALCICSSLCPSRGGNKRVPRSDNYGSRY